MARIFLCEDDDAFRLLTRLRLEEAGHEIVGEAASSEPCLDGVVETAADVALIDGFLDDDGWARLRAAAPDTKLVILSGVPEDLLAEEARRLGADAHLFKGADVEELVALVGRLAG